MENTLQEVLIPVAPGTSIDAQKNALEQIQEKKPMPQSERPAEIDIQDFVSGLIAAFQNDFTVEEACSYVGISPSTYYRNLKDNPEFAEEIARAKMFVELEAKKRVNSILRNGEDREAGPMARWLLERKQPSIYRPAPATAIDNRTQNFLLLNHGQISDISKQPDISKSSPAELFKALKEQSKLESGAKEGSTP